MDPSLPDLHDLRAFCAVVDLGSLTSAARSLNETKGAISRRIARLEKNLGVTLLLRTPRLVRPTDEGAQYRARVGRVIEELEAARVELAAEGSTPRGRLRVTAPPDLALELMAPITARYVESYPEVTIEMLATERVLDFDANQLDVALRVSSGLADSSLIAHRLGDLDAIFVAAPSYLSSHGTPDDLSALKAHRLILFGPSTRRVASLYAERDLGAPPRMAVHASDANFARSVAIAGGGVALLPRILVEVELKNRTLAPILENVTFEGRTTLYLLHRSARVVPSKVRLFLEMTQRFLRRCEREQPQRRGAPSQRSAVGS